VIRGLTQRASVIVLAAAMLSPSASLAQRRPRTGTTASGASAASGSAGSFQEPTAERAVAAPTAEAEAPRTTGSAQPAREPEDTASLEERLYLRERPDAIGEAARDFADDELARLLAEREGLLVERRDQAIGLLEEFIREEPETAAEMPDALLRLAELRWELARFRYLQAFNAWQQVPEENRGAEPSPDYRPAIELYDRILTLHRDFPRYVFVLYMKAYALTEIGDAEGALALYHRIVDEFPQSRFVPDAHMAFAETYFANTDFLRALPEFEQVMSYRDSELYDMALFKSAWCLWRLNRTTEAATRFRQVLDLGGSSAQLSADQRRRLRELQNEALDYLIQVFTEDERNTARDVFRFLQEIGGEQYAERVLTRLSLTYMDQARYDQGIDAYRLLLEMSPADPRAPQWQHQIASAYAAMDDDTHTLEALTALADNYLVGGSWIGQQTDPEVVENARTRVERAIRVRAMRWHELGQRATQSQPEAAGDALNATARRRLEQAQAGYDLYLEHFGEDPNAYDLHFYRAEILFHRLQRYEDAGEEYLAAARMRPDGQYTRDALYNAIGAFEHVREGQLEECQRRGGPGATAQAASAQGASAQGASAQGASQGASAQGASAQGASETATSGTPSGGVREADPRRSEGASSTSGGAGGSGGELPTPPGGAEGASEDPCGETDNDRAFSEAIELYVQYFPTDPDLPEILFRQGRLYYDRSIFDPAVRLFGQLLERFPTSSYATQAGELILDSFNRAQDFGNIEAWARRLKDAPAFQSAESQRRLDTLILQAAFARGEQLANRGEHREAAEAFEHAADEFPNDERARQALYNAGLERQRAGDLGGASSTYDRLVERYPGSTEGALGAWNGAQMFESIAQFRDAAHFYESYGARFPQGPHHEDALFNATLLRLSAGDHDAAVVAAQQFLERYPRSESADEITFFQARAHAAAHRWEEAARVYQEYVRRSRNVDRNVEAQARLAQVWMDAGNQEEAGRALEAAVRTGRGSLRRLSPEGRHFMAQARYLQGEAVLRQFEAITIDGDVAGLRQRLERKSQLLRQAAEIFADVVSLRVAEWVTAALYQVGRSYELFASGLRDAPIPEGLTEEEEQAYRDQLSYFIVPIEEQALEAYEGGYATAIELRIYNSWTAQLRDGLTRLNDVQYPPLRELGGELHEGARLAPMRPLDGLRRGEQASAVTTTVTTSPTTTPTAEPGATTNEPAQSRPSTRRRRRRAR
jgi:tetratricopeptide (TPR) repeat protein